MSTFSTPEELVDFIVTPRVCVICGQILRPDHKCPLSVQVTRLAFETWVEKGYDPEFPDVLPPGVDDRLPSERGEWS
jgi:hypothetical protein